jgi:hypothetical protein
MACHALSTCQHLISPGLQRGGESATWAYGVGDGPSPPSPQREDGTLPVCHASWLPHLRRLPLPSGPRLLRCQLLPHLMLLPCCSVASLLPRRSSRNTAARCTGSGQCCYALMGAACTYLQCTATKGRVING